MTPRKKFKPCGVCGGLMEKGEEAYLCPTCHNIEWFTGETESTTSVARCPHCGSASPNLNYCVYCSMPIPKRK
jgi:DNA-directed RNA polymerase subunit RPC12/RpoP